MKVSVTVEGDKTLTFTVETPGKVTSEMLDALNEGIKRELGLPIEPKVVERHYHHYDWWGGRTIYTDINTGPMWTSQTKGMDDIPYTITCSATG